MSPFRQTAPECLVEPRKEALKVLHASCLVCLPSVEKSTLGLATRYETWQHLVRITAWIPKWLQLRGQTKKGKLSAQEIKESEYVCRQRDAFLPEIEQLCNKK